MQPKEMQRLDPYYTGERGFAEFSARDTLHQMLPSLDSVVALRGEHLEEDDPRLNILHLYNLLTIEPEAHLEAWLLPSHDSTCRRLRAIRLVYQRCRSAFMSLAHMRQ